MPSFREKALRIVAAIPMGRVTTYGAIARRLKTSPRQVARVLVSLTRDEAEEYPWFRVVAAKGVVSSIKLGAVGRRQIERLRVEGSRVSSRNAVEEFDTRFWPPGPLAKPA